MEVGNDAMPSQVTFPSLIASSSVFCNGCMIFFNSISSDLNAWSCWKLLLTPSIRSEQE